MENNPLNVENMDLGNIQDTLQRVNMNAGKQVGETVKAILEGAMKKGIMPKTALKIDDNTMEAIYAQAYNLYNQGKYKEASYIFRLIMMLDFTVPKYILGLAACMHRMKDYQNAANVYFLCSTLDPTNPMPHYHSVDCYLQIDAPELALLSLGMAIKAAGDQPQYAVLKERAILLQNGLEAQSKERAAKNYDEKGKKREAPKSAENI